jgi:hypothetical protein
MTRIAIGLTVGKAPMTRPRGFKFSIKLPIHNLDGAEMI